MFDFHAGHVDAGGAFAFAGFAADAEFQGFGDVVAGEVSALAGQGEAEGVGAASGDVGFVSGDAVAGAHAAGIEAAAGAVVVAHFDGAEEAAGPGGPVELFALV